MRENDERPRWWRSVGLAGLALATLWAITALPVSAEFHTDSDFVDGVEHGDVRAITRIGDTIYVGGEFTEVKHAGGGSVAQAYLAAFDATTGEWRSGFAPTFDGIVRDLAPAAAGDRLFVAGHFKYIDGVKRRGIVALDPDTGAVDGAFNAVAWGHGKAVEVDGDDVYFAGGFGQVNGGLAIPRLAKLDATTGEADTSWVPRPDTGPEGLSVPPAGGVLYLAGAERLDGVTNPHNAEISRVFLESGVRDPAFRPDRATPARDVDATDERVFVAHGGSNRFSVYDAADGTELAVYTGDGDFQRTEIIGRRAFVGSHSSRLGAVDRLQIAAVDWLTGDVDLSFDTPVRGGHGVRAIYGAGSNLHLGGQISHVGTTEVPGNGYARIGPAPGEAVPTVPADLSLSTDGVDIALTWTGSTDPDGTVVGYRVLRSGHQVAVTTSTSFVDTNAQDDVDYVYEVEALDDAHNLSPTSAAVVGSNNDDPPPVETAAALVVADPANLEQLDVLANYLLVVNGSTVDIVDDDAVDITDFSGYDLVNVGRSVSSGKVAGHLNDIAAPVLVNKPYLYDDVGLTGLVAGTDYGLRTFDTLDLDPAHPVGAGLPDPILLLDTPLSAGWGIPAAGAEVIGALDTGEAVVFVYRSTSLLADGTPAAGCRAAFPAHTAYLENLTAAGFRLYNQVLNDLIATC